MGRFVAIFAIVALGVGFYAGLRMTAPDMNRSADAFYDGTGLMDIRVVSTMGLDAEDLDALRAVDGVEEVMGARECDVMADIGGEPYAVRVHSLPESAASSVAESEVEVASDDPSYLNRLVLAEGRWPERADECVMSADRIMNSPLEMGDVVRVDAEASSSDGTLAVVEYKVVGLAHSSYYASSTSMGTTSLGSGRIQQFMYVPDGAFDAEYPLTEAFVTVSGAKGLSSPSDEYDGAVAEVLARIEAISEAREDSRLESLKADAQAELDEARAKFESERADALAELAGAKAELDDAAAEIAYGESALEDAKRQREKGAADLAERKAQAERGFEDAGSEIARKSAELDAARKALVDQEAQLEAARPVLPPDQVAQAEEQLAQAKAQTDAAAARLEGAVSQLEEQRGQAAAQFAAAQAQLDAAAARMAAGASELEQGRAEYASGLAEYETAQRQAQEGFAQAEAELASAQADIDAIERPEWLVMDRSKNHGAESFAQDAGRVDSIAQVFPLIFFLVAALVALTTMTRMVEEERMTIGTYKALGYSKGRIASKYLLYALAASLGGSAAGIAALSFSLPAVIMLAYSIVYIVPSCALAIDWPIALTSTALGSGITLLATWGAVWSTLRESPAALMLPRAPKAGKRILLERVKPVWSRTSFLWKVTLRNIFRYKKRMLMTVVGIAGCTALLLTGFGLHDSINDIIDKHYGEIVGCNLTIELEDDATDADAAQLQEVLDAHADVSLEARAGVRNVSVLGDGADYRAELVAPDDPAAFELVHSLHDRTSGREYDLSVGGAVVSEKLAGLAGVQEGGVVRVSGQDSMGNPKGEPVEVPVLGVCEHYVDNAVFMSGKTYEEAFGEPLAQNTVFVESGVARDAGASEAPGEPGASDASGAGGGGAGGRVGKAELSQRLLDVPGVKTVSFSDEVIESYRTALNSVNMVVVVLIVAAALLAFIVLYNLTNINITERLREIATLKVLGFTRSEVQRYIFREIAILAVMGALAGLALGVFLENFVVVTAEVDVVMFGREVHPASFAAAFACTMLFAAVVALFMRGKLDRVDMVESLKSNE